MSYIAVIDTETNWYNEVMSVGAVVADINNYKAFDSRYYIIDPAFKVGGMYSNVLKTPGTPKEIIKERGKVLEEMRYWLKSHGVNKIFAYNAKFDMGHLPEFCDFDWHDIMRIAAYKQFNRHIPDTVPCCKTGRIKTDYGVEAIYRLLSKNNNYMEKHNGWHDAMDELKIMKLLGLPAEIFDMAKI